MARIQMILDFCQSTYDFAQVSLFTFLRQRYITDAHHGYADEEAQSTRHFAGLASVEPVSY